MLKNTSAAIALLALTNPALINPALAAGCAAPNEAAALRTAVIQQEMMVAALQCHETEAYNRFVTAYRGELQTSDAVLKAFFVRRGGEHGEAGYDSFKTKAANLSALEQARDAPAFCADAHALFAAAFANRGSLMSFVQTQAVSTDIGGICAESRPVPIRADAIPASGAAPTVKVAEANSADVGGVPAHSLPAIPYRRGDTVAAAPRIEDDAARDADADEDDAAPSYSREGYVPRQTLQRYYQTNPPDYAGQGYGYAPSAYGPPPGWRRDWRDYPPPPPPPPPRWYRPGLYGAW
ncbi:MAG TPA: hypothetical protein VN175_09705 [Rhizomicrobium sp.]|nr:hypothetical protein [Rhizomicrobium sp.]